MTKTAANAWVVAMRAFALSTRITEAVVGAGPLGDDGPDEAEGDSRAQACGQERRRSRHVHAPEDVPAAGAHGAQSSSSCGSVARKPSSAVTAIGKKAISAQMATRGGAPYPSQSTSSGASAITGIVCETTTSGVSRRSRRRECRAAAAKASATTAPMANPAPAS